MRLKNKVVIVTGGANGLGEGYSFGLAEEGAKVVIADLDAKNGERVRQEIKKKGGEATFVLTDISKKGDADHLLAETINQYGQIDIVVNNAGTFFSAPVLEHTEEMWDKSCAVNIKGVFFVSQAAAKEMVKRKRGKIINISSIAGYGAQPTLCAYGSTKAAITMMTRVFALELAPFNIQVNALLPGTTDAGMVKEAMKDPTWTKQTISGIPLGRLGTSRDMLGAVLYFASEDSNYCTGQTLIVDGGYSMI